jgi:hypothetical protein
MTVLFHRRAATRRVNEYRTVVLGQGGHRRFSSMSGVVGEPGVGLESTATRGERTGWRDAEPGGLDDPLAGMVNIALPRVHDAAGEDVDVGAAGVVASSPQRQITGNAESLGNEPHSGGDGEGQ